MKRILFLLSLVFMFFGVSESAQPAKNAASSSAPKLTTKEPSFAGFTGSFFKFGDVSGKNRPFTMFIEYKPWFFEISGLADAGRNTEDLDILLDNIVAVLAYYDAGGKAPDGTAYQAGLFDFMVYLDDEPIKVSNLKIALKSKAESGSATLEQAKTWNFELGKVFKTPKYSDAIVKAQASAMDKSDIAKEEAAAKKRVADSIAREKKRVADSIAREKQRVEDSIAKAKKQIAREKKRIADSIAEAEEAAEALKKEERRKAAAAKKKRIADSIAAAEEAEALKKEERRKAAAAKKKKAEDSPPKKKPTFTVVEDEEDAPPPKKRRKTTD